MTQDLHDEIQNLKQELLLKDITIEMSKSGFEDVKDAAKIFLSENSNLSSEALTPAIENWKESKNGKRFLKAETQETSNNPKRLTAKELSKGLKEGIFKLKVN